MLKALSLGFRILIGLLIIGAAFGIFGLMVATREAPGVKPELFRPIKVRGVELQPQQVARSWTGYGTARPMDRADTPAQVSARVINRPPEVEVGNAVEAGQVLFELDPVDFQLAQRSAAENIASLEAQLGGLDVEEERVRKQLEFAAEETTVAQRDYDRARDTISRGAGSEAELDSFLAAVRRTERAESAIRQQVELIPSRRAELSARLEAQRVALRQAEENLSRTTIKSPIAGVIQHVALDEGEWAQAGQVVARVVSMSRIEVPLSLPVSASPFLQVGDPVSIRSRVGDQAIWDGAIARIAPEADTQTRSIMIFVEVDQSPGSAMLLRPGQFVTGVVLGAQRSERVLVPRRAIVDDRVLIAAPADTPEASVWPVARRIAESLARSALQDSHTPLTGSDSDGTLTDSMSQAAQAEVGAASGALTDAVAKPTVTWLKSSGAQSIEDQFVRVLTAHLTPDVANWLVHAEQDQLPQSLRDELAQARRLQVVKAVPVESLFTLEGGFSDLDPNEQQWVAVRPTGDFDLRGATLITTNLDQLIDGMLVDVTVGGGS